MTRHDPTARSPGAGGIRETESASPRFRDLELWSRSDLLGALLDGQTRALFAVSAALPAIEAAVEAASARLLGPGGRLVYAGAGTSGRIAVQDGVELHPTFNWPNERLVFVLAGGEAGLIRAQEGAEDDRADAAAALEKARIGPPDVLVGLAASGATPFTVAAVEAARAAGALTVGLANNPDAPLLDASERPILLRTGAEVLAGSTRMAAGTAQKIALNLFSTALMVALGKVRGGRMVDMRVSNSKLRARARSMLADLAGCAPDEAERALEAHGYDVAAALDALGGPAR